MAVRPRLPRLVRWFLAVIGGLLVGVAVIYLGVELAYQDRILPLQSVPPAPVAIVFGAGLAPAGQPSPMLAARVKTAVGLYHTGRVQKVLLSGNSERHHDEIAAMRRMAEASGLPPSALLLDTEGLSTFDSCLRAREVFGVQRAILVTQRFHMPRALFVANSLGLQAWGVVTNPGTGSPPENFLRELLARPLALVLVVVQPRHDAMPEPEPPEAEP